MTSGMYKRTKKQREKISLRLIGNDYALGYKFSKKQKKRASLGQEKRYEDPKEIEKSSIASKKHFRDHPVSDKTKEKMSVSALKRFEDPKEKEMASERMKEVMLRPGVKDKLRKASSRFAIKRIEEHPELINGNGYGTPCYSSDGKYFPSIEEKDCYEWVKDVPMVVKVEKFGRFDLIVTLINGIKIVLEYHHCSNFFDERTIEEYYKDRRELLDTLGHKDLKLIVMTSLKGEEKKRVKNILRKWSRHV